MSDERRVHVSDEQQAIDALSAVVAWATRDPDFTHGGPTSLTHQRGRVIASLDALGTIGVSTYATVEEAALMARDMERAYRNWLALRDNVWPES